MFNLIFKVFVCIKFLLHNILPWTHLNLEWRVRSMYKKHFWRKNYLGALQIFLCALFWWPLEGRFVCVGNTMQVVNRGNFCLADGSQLCHFCFWCKIFSSIELPSKDITDDKRSICAGDTVLIFYSASSSPLLIEMNEWISFFLKNVMRKFP